MNKKYFSSGELARYAGITKDALFHYEKNGLITPEVVKPNGYRYYTSDQFDRLNTIVTLRNVDVSISEIKQFFEKNTLEELYTLYEEKEKEVKAKIKIFKQTRAMLHTKKKHIQMLQQAVIGQINHEYMPKAYLQLSMPIEGSEETAFDEAIADLILKKGTQQEMDIGAMVSKQSMEEGVPHYLYVYRQVQKSKCIKPEGEYLTLYHRGHFEDTHVAYTQLLAYIKAQGIDVEDTLYEQVLLESISISKKEPLVMKIMAKVKE